MREFVLQIRMSEAEYAAVESEAQKRGKKASALAREVLVEVLTGPGAATVGRRQAKKDAGLPPQLKELVERKPRKKMTADNQTAGYIDAIKNQGKPVSMADRQRQMREANAR